MKLSSKIGFSIVTLSLLLNTHCSSSRPAVESKNQETSVSSSEITPAQSKITEPKQSEPKLAEDKPENKIEAPISTAHSPATAKEKPSSSHSGEASGVPAEKALGWLKNGNKRFISGRLRKDGQSAKDIQKLSKGQHPHSIIFSCSDSRVPPEIVFDQKLGEVFVIRDAGEVPETASIASMEYAVEHLGARLLVVMGHTQCGAVKAALSTMNGEDAGSPSLNNLVQAIHPHLQDFKGKALSSDLAAESYAHAKADIKEILLKSELLRKKVANGDLKIKAALYRIETGSVEFSED